ncbi:MAG: UDP-N-acetylmuramate:L-alanyl-gamma-D-glutamyl-meso-diaminopimelate ligase [Bdellovibrionaceae bacterium]|nr:UDP-N-acetylmuramate:L-alanyl-gamma-D-glutamyl-meso-diaminopimelate ligase [Pseudobdellovibrionaceae bacterium]
MELKPGSRVHLMGICGTAMASLAGLLKDKGFVVTGSDSNPYPPMSTQIENLGIKILTPYSEKNLSPTPDFVIVGNVISANNPEAVELKNKNIPFTSLPKALGEWIIDQKNCICISGTHGKTTTTSMMSWVLDQAEKEPGFLIGGIPINFHQSFRNPKGDYFVIEGDEYDTAFFDKVPKFIHYKPRNVILTSVEFDHADIYKDLDDVKKAFTRLVKIIPPQGSLVYWADDKNIPDLLEDTNTKNVYSYGLTKKSRDNHAWIEMLSNATATTSLTSDFCIHFKGEKWGPFQLAQPGEYNVLNAAAVVLMSYHLGVSPEITKKALVSFKGVKRRQEILGEPGGRLLVEDFAHHPTAVRETLKGIRKKYPNRKIHAVFEPRSATSRRKIFQDDYAHAFESADKVYIMKAFDQSKLADEEKFSSEDLVKDLNKKSNRAALFENVDTIVSNLKKESVSGDLIIVMSNGGFDGIYDKILKTLS